MNSNVNFEISRLLKEKNWDKETLCHYFEDGVFRQNELRDTIGMDYGSEHIVEFSELINNWNDAFLMKKNGDRCFGCNKNQGYFETFSAPTIAEVVMWLYEKHGIWIQPSSKNTSTQMSFKYEIKRYEWDGCITDDILYNSPTETYLAGIKYCLEKII